MGLVKALTISFCDTSILIEVKILMGIIPFLVTHGCSLIKSIVNLYLGSLFKRPFSRDVIKGSVFSGIYKG